MNMKRNYTVGLILSIGSLNAATVSWNGAATTDVDNWETSSVAFDDTVQSGHSLNWENVLVNTAAINSAANVFDVSFQASTNYTIGHLFMYGESFDLGGTLGGLEALTMTADLEGSSFANWSPVVGVTVGGATTYYRWNHSGNSFKGNAALDFSLGNFDLSQNGNATNTTTVLWGELNSAAAAFGGTRDNGTNPNLQATSGSLQVGFIQWGASTGGSVDPQANFTTGIDAWDTTFTYSDAVPEPSSLLLTGLSALFLIRRKR